MATSQDNGTKAPQTDWSTAQKRQYHLQNS